MSETGITPEPTLREKLRAYLPKEAIKAHPTKSYLSSINPMYVIERLNDVFGEEGWDAKYAIVERGPMVVVECILKCRMPGAEWIITRQTFGGNDNKDLGDAYKGACTDALTKAASQIGIGAEVYKGIYDGKAASVDKKAERGFKKDFEKRTADQSRTITAAEAKVFLSACNKGGKTKEQVQARLTSMKIGKLSEMLHTDYEAELKWATGTETDYQDTLKRSVASIQAPESDKHNFRLLFGRARERGIPEADVKRVGYEIYHVKSLNDLTSDQFDGLLEWLDSQAVQA